jgi:hypothetical protein
MDWNKVPHRKGAVPLVVITVTEEGRAGAVHFDAFAAPGWTEILTKPELARFELQLQALIRSVADSAMGTEWQGVIEKVA